MSKQDNGNKRGKKQDAAVAVAEESKPEEPQYNDELVEEEYKPGEADSMFGDVQDGRNAQNFGASAKRMVGLMVKDWPALIAIFVFTAISVVLTVIGPKVLGKAMDTITQGFIGLQLGADERLAPLKGQPAKEVLVPQLRDSGQKELQDQAEMLSKYDVVIGEGINFTQLSQLILTVLAIYFVASFFMWLQGYILNRVVMKAIKELRTEVEDKLNRLPLSYFDTAQRGDVISRVTNDIDNVQQGLQQAFSQLVSNILMVIGFAIMMFTVSWDMALVALLLAIPITFAVAGVLSVRTQKLYREKWKSTGQVNGQIEESFSGHALVTIFGREQDMRDQFFTKNQELYQSSFKAEYNANLMWPVMQWVNYLSYVVIAVMGGLKVATGQITLGDATAFIQYSREFNQPLTQVGSLMPMVNSAVAAAERVFEFLDAEDQKPDDATEHLPEKTDGRVNFQSVDFSYTPDKPLIEDLSFEARPGSTVAIVGPTGAGKTTLVNLIMRFYELNSGKITLDGVDITELSRAELRSKVGMVLQDAWLFKGSIYENIRYGNLEATEEQIMAAAKATYVDRFVHNLPEGYETVIEDEGSNISAGEMQLITIARAFVADPSLLILDEATSSVDTRTELLVQKAMSALRADRTSFVIAHRLSTIRDANVILVMEAGRIVEQGNHEQLLAAQGAYYRLYQSQFAGEDAEEQLEATLAAEDPGIENPGTGSLPVVDESSN